MSRFRQVQLIALGSVLLAAFALRLQNLGLQSLWYDETVTAYLANQSLGALIAHTARDIHPPLYYILIHFWINFVGASEFALAFFSLMWGMLLLISGATFARWLGGNQVALITAAIMALSPFNVWYSQEVRMYTMGATFGIWTLMAVWQLLYHPRGRFHREMWLIWWLLSAAAGLYTLYYFAFLLLWEGLFVAGWLIYHRADFQQWRRWIRLAVGLVILWGPWIPVAWRQATNPPVPPWREGTAIGTIVLETMSGLALGQSADVEEVMWPIVLLGVVILGGLALRFYQRPHSKKRKQWLLQTSLLGGALLVPLLILILSTYTPSPLYHVRYMFTYSASFYILMALAFAGWVREANRWARLPGTLGMALVLLTPLIVLSEESLQRFWYDTTYAADDLRGGIKQVEQLWREDDLLLMNAGYTYTALNTYFADPIAWQRRLTTWDASQEPDEPGLTVLQTGSIDGAPSLGWGSPESDFYAISAEETFSVLETVSQRYQRLWQYRLYDTVTDPNGLIRNWLDENALLFYDELLTGESNARIQGWYFPSPPNIEPDRPINTEFFSPDDNNTPWIVLYGADEPKGPSVGGRWVDIRLWLAGSAALDPSTRLSLGLFDTTPSRRQWTVTDEQPLGPLLSLQELPGVQGWPVRLRLPQGLPPGKYDAQLKFYRPADGAVLTARGERMVGQEQVRVVVVEVGPTPPLETPPAIGTPFEAYFGPLQLLGHAIPAGPWEPGATIPVELVWRLTEPVTNLRAFVGSDALSSDDGGLAQATPPYPPDEWRAGELVRDTHYVTVAPNAKPGDYPLFLRVNQDATIIPWSRGLFSTGDILQIGTLTITDRERSFDKPTIGTPFDIAFGESITLIGATLPDTSYAPGSDVPLTLNWQAISRPTGRYKIFTHLIDMNGNLRAQRDLEPGDGHLPTNGWAEGEYITTNFTIPLPSDLPPDTYKIRVGFYDPVTNERVVPRGDNINNVERYLQLGTVVVE